MSPILERDGLKHTFDPQCTYVIEMVAVNVRIYTEKPAHDRADCITEVLWKGYT